MYVHVYSVCGLQRDGGEKLLKFCKFKHDLKDSVPVQSNFKLAFEWVCNCEVIFQTEASVHCYAYNDTVSFSGRLYLSFKQTSLARVWIWSTLLEIPRKRKKIRHPKHFIRLRWQFCYPNVILHMMQWQRKGGTRIKVTFFMNLW